MKRAESDDVTFIVESQTPGEVRLPRIDANEIYGRTLGGELPPTKRLLPRLENALQSDSDDRTVEIDDDPMRVDLLSILSFIEADGKFSEPLAELRQALQDTVVGGKF